MRWRAWQEGPSPRGERVAAEWERTKANWTAKMAANFPPEPEVEDEDAVDRPRTVTPTSRTHLASRRPYRGIGSVKVSFGVPVQHACACAKFVQHLQASVCNVADVCCVHAGACGGLLGGRDDHSP